MVGSRAATAAAGLAVSFLVSAALWWYFQTAVFFLFLPFVPILLRDRGEGDDRDDGWRDGDDATPAARTCPECGFRTTKGEFEYCPRDGRRLQ